MRKIQKIKLFITYSVLFLLVVASLTGAVVYWILPEPPDAAIKTARENLSAARDAHADRYAPEPFRTAVACYDSAMVRWRSENQKFILFRNYSPVIYYADSSSTAAAESLEKALKNARDAKHKTGTSFETLQEDVARMAKLYGGLPLSGNFRENFNRAKLLVEEIRIARNKGDFHKAAQILETARKLLEEAENYAETRMKDYFDDFGKWKSLYDEAIAVSLKNKNTLIVVDKLSHELRLYKDGRLRSSYIAEFGPNWIGDKNHQGDQATPEGSYRVVKKKERRQTRYYKALLLNYPNGDDLERYRSNVRRGVIPSHVDVGGLIEVHGHGGQGFNWTNGCVALNDKDMDAVYRQVQVNTPVVIIGSLVPFEEWQNNTLTGREPEI